MISTKKLWLLSRICPKQHLCSRAKFLRSPPPKNMASFNEESDSSPLLTTTFNFTEASFSSFVDELEENLTSSASTVSESGAQPSDKRNAVLQIQLDVLESACNDVSAGRLALQQLDGNNPKVILRTAQSCNQFLYSHYPSTGRNLD